MGTILNRHYNLEDHLEDLDTYMCPYCPWEGLPPNEEENGDLLCPICKNKIE